ncbi:MAG: hypothetical protein ACJ764_15310 [Solirubrobacteraceae bacterium]
MRLPPLVALALTLLVLLTPQALAQNSANPLQQAPGSPLTPFEPQPAPSPPVTTPTVATTPTSGSGGGLGGGAAVAIAVGAIVVLGGISLYIWRDARKRAPVRHRAAAATVPGSARQRQKSRKLSPAERKRRKRGRAR